MAPPLAGSRTCVAYMLPIQRIFLRFQNLQNLIMFVCAQQLSSPKVLHSCHYQQTQPYIQKRFSFVFTLEKFCAHCWNLKHGWNEQVSQHRWAPLTRSSMFRMQGAASRVMIPNRRIHRTGIHAFAGCSSPYSQTRERDTTREWLRYSVRGQ
jgi:hypothetical protein